MFTIPTSSSNDFTSGKRALNSNETQFPCSEHKRHKKASGHPAADSWHLNDPSTTLSQMCQIADEVKHRRAGHILENAKQAEEFFIAKVPYDDMAKLAVPLQYSALFQLLRRYGGIVDQSFDKKSLISAATGHIFNNHPDNVGLVPMTKVDAKSRFGQMSGAERQRVTSLEYLQIWMRQNSVTPLPSTGSVTGAPLHTTATPARQQSVSLDVILHCAPKLFTRSLPTFERERKSIRETQAGVPHSMNQASSVVSS
ncbi:MAG: hypothetical protein JWP52_3155, partial [Rhizobacter sp.]|nr:hypothetical protein [Rhizobacter sp.]